MLLDEFIKIKVIICKSILGYNIIRELLKSSNYNSISEQITIAQLFKIIV